MARLLGLIGNRPDLGGRVLALESEALSVRTRGSPLGWGLGFYQGGEVLMRRRPIDDRDEIDLAKLAADVRADILMAHVRSATVGALRTENTHPFRHRQWLFAQTGTLGRAGERSRIARARSAVKGNLTLLMSEIGLQRQRAYVFEPKSMDPERTGVPSENPASTGDDGDGGIREDGLPSKVKLLAYLERAGGNVSEVARKVGKGRKVIYRLMEEYGIKGEGTDP